MNKIIVLIVFSIFLNNSPYINNKSNNLNAGIIKWGAKKLISSSIKLIFNNVKDNVVEHYKQKLVKYLNKHPEYIEYAIKSVKKRINKHPKYKDKGYKLLKYISQNTPRYKNN